MGILLFATESCFVWGWRIGFVAPGRRTWQLGRGKPNDLEQSVRGEGRGAFAKVSEKSWGDWSSWRSVSRPLSILSKSCLAGWRTLFSCQKEMRQRHGGQWREALLGFTFWRKWYAPRLLVAVPHSRRGAHRQPWFTSHSSGSPRWRDCQILVGRRPASWLIMIPSSHSLSVSGRKQRCAACDLLS